VTEFSKTFLVFYKWLNLTDVQGIVHSKVCLVIFVCCEHALWYFFFLSPIGFTSLHYIKFSYFYFLPGPAGVKEFKKGDSQTKDQ
jgi:hypothetical protein